jgi:hypothetical protein
MRPAARFLLGVAALALVAIASLTIARASAAARGQGDDFPGIPRFLAVDRCYQFAVQTPTVTRYRVLELLDDGWIKAEADVGTSGAQREQVWINMGQVLTAREARCSD